MVRRLHRLNALILLVFIAIHFANHLIGLTGLANHIAIMEMLRSVYRVQIVEILIFFLFFSQIALGLLLITKRGKPQGNWAWAQIISGGLIGFFLLQHLSAVIMMRLTYAQLDTNFYWAASVVNAKPMGWYFLPYYALGLFSVFVHLAAALHFARPNKPILPRFIVFLGAAMALMIPASLAGAFFSVSLPPEYIQYLRELYPNWLVTNF